MLRLAVTRSLKTPLRRLPLNNKVPIRPKYLASCTPSSLTTSSHQSLGIRSPIAYKSTMAVREMHSSRACTSEAPHTQDSVDLSQIVVKEASVKNGLDISDKAIKRLKYIAERDNDTNLMLRVLVDSGGCHGYQNKLELTDTLEEDDTIFEKEGIRVVVDAVSLQFVRGSTVDFVEELIGSTFQVVDNPNAKNSCGCNISYDIDLDMITQN